MALEKPVIMLCDNMYRNGKFPFDISHRNVLVYRSGSIRDFNDCLEKLKERIVTKLKRMKLTIQDGNLTAEERLILKALSRDQKTAEAMILEEKSALRI